MKKILPGIFIIFLFTGAGCIADEATSLSINTNTQETTCLYEGQELAIGQSYDDGCNTHTCQEDGTVVSTEIACEIQDSCTKISIKENVQFTHPCTWELDVSGDGATWSSVGTLVAPDGKASFTYPAPEIGLHGKILVEETEIKINNKMYPIKTYEGNGQHLSFVLMGNALNENGYNFMIASEGTAHAETLESILESITF